MLPLPRTRNSSCWRSSSPLSLASLLRPLTLSVSPLTLLSHLSASVSPASVALPEEIMGVEEIPMCNYFDPTDEELLLVHLKEKVEGQPVTVPIPTLKVYDVDPWRLPLGFKGNKGFFYCFTQLHRCSGTDHRIKRSVGSSGGTWFTNNTRVITVGGEVVGHRSFLSYQVKKKSTGWVMYEYRLTGGDSSSSSPKLQELVVICKIKNRSKLEGCGKRKTREEDDDPGRCRSGSSNIDHYGSCLQPTTSPDQPLLVDGRSDWEHGRCSSSNGDHHLSVSTSTDQSLVTVDPGVPETFPCDPWDIVVDDQVLLSLEELLGEGENSDDHVVGSSLPGERTDQRSSTDGPMQPPESTGQTPVVVDGRSGESSTGLSKLLQQQQQQQEEVVIKRSHMSRRGRKVWRRLKQCMRTMGTPVEETTVEMIPGPQWYYEDLHRQLLMR